MLKWNLSRISSVTFFIVWCVLRRSWARSLVRGLPPAQGATGFQCGQVFGNEPPYPGKKPERTFNALVTPVEVLFRRRREQAKEPHSVRPICLNHLIRVYHVALRFAHFEAVFYDHSLCEKVHERLIDFKIPHVAKGFHKKSRIEQMQDGVFNSADVLVNGHPVASPFPVEGSLVEVGAGVSGEVPGGFHEGVHGIRLAPRIAPAFRACGRVERLVDGQGGAAVFQELDIERKHNGQVLLGDRHDTALLTVNDQEWARPSSAAAKCPNRGAGTERSVLQALFLPGTRLSRCGRLAESIPVNSPESTKTPSSSNACVRSFGQRDFLCLSTFYDYLDRQAVFFRKLEVALVVRRDRHDRACAVGHDNKVRHVNRHLFRR